MQIDPKNTEELLQKIKECLHREGCAAFIFVVDKDSATWKLVGKANRLVEGINSVRKLDGQVNKLFDLISEHSE